MAPYGEDCSMPTDEHKAKHLLLLEQAPRITA
jgi:hypothetical protein